MPFQPGNQAAATINKQRSRICAQRLIATLNETDANNIPKLHRLANALLEKALEGDVAAIKEVMDRVDGRVPQQIQGDPDNPLIIERVIHEIVKPEPIVNSGYLPEPSFNARNPQAS